MNSLLNYGKKLSFLFSLVFIFLLATPTDSNAQWWKNWRKKKKPQYELTITIDCIEYLGKGKYRANFGYELTNSNGLEVSYEKSDVNFKSGRAKIFALNQFFKGRHHSVFSVEFDSWDEATWTIELPNGTVKIVTASINSPGCQPDLGLDPIFEADGEGGVIWPELAFLADNPDQASDVVFQLEEDPSDPSNSRVLVEIYANENIDDLLSGFELQRFEEPFTYIGYYPISSLQGLNDFPDRINFVRPVYPPFTGAIISEGDAAMKSDIVRDAYELDGTGIKIGVLSDSYNQNGKAEADKDITDGELPSNGVELVPSSEIADPIRGIDEGRAMLQIVHDVAPGADLAFRTGFNNARDFAVGIQELADADCDIIVDDITYITEPFYRDGKVAQAVQSVTNNDGVVYVTSAGNFANNSVEGEWTGVSPPQAFPFLRNPTDLVHDYGGNVFQRIQLEPIDNGDGTTSPATILMVLQWDDEFFSLSSSTTPLKSSTNLDIWIVDDNGNLLYSGNRDNTDEDPIEVLAFQVSQPLMANVLISGSSVNGPIPSGLDWKYIIYRSRGLSFLNPVGSGKSTITGHANSNEAVTVGAANAAFSGTPVLQSFSSTGGTKVFTTSGEETRQKPDIVGPDGVSTTVFDLQTFFGTSAAAPHIAGAAALIAQAKKEFYPEDPALTSSELKGIFQQPGAAIDMDASSFDLNSGYGFFQVTGALSNLANPTPQLLALIAQRPPESPNAGEPANQGTAATEGVEIVVTAEYLSENVKVLYNGEEINADINPVAGEDDKYSIIIPPFIGNPTINLQNPPLSNGLDGGTSQTLNIFDNVTPIVLSVSPQGPATKFFGEISPTFDCEICLPTETTGQFDISGEVPFNLPPLTFVSPEDFDPAGVYSIKPAFISSSGDLIQESDEDFPANLIEEIASLNSFEASTFSDVYQIDLENLRFDITQLPLTIKMKDQSILYGSTIPIEFEFAFLDDSGNEIPHNNKEATVNEVALNYSISYLNPDDPGDIYGIINRGRALRNDEEVIPNRGRALRNGEEPLTLLDGKSFVATLAVLSDGEVDPLSNRGRALRNRGRALRNRGRALRNDYIYDLDQTHIFNFFGMPSPENIPLEGSEMLDESVVPEYTANRGRALRNQEDFLANGASFSNRGRALRNASPLANSSEFSYGEMIVIIDESEVEGEGPDGEVIQYYAIAMVSGVDVTEVDEGGNPVPGKENKIIPGGFIDVEYEDPNIDFSSNFDISYTNGNLLVAPGDLTPTVKLNDSDESLSITYGDPIPMVSTTYEGFQYDEFEAFVFEPVTYLLVDASDASKTFDPTNPESYPDAGTYNVVGNYTFKADLPVNYILQDQNEITLTINKKELSSAIVVTNADGTMNDGSITYGDPLPEFSVLFEGFENEQNEEDVYQPITFTLSDESRGVEGLETYDQASTFEIVPNILLLSDMAENYNLQLPAATFLEVKKALLTPTVSIESPIITYGDPLPEISTSYDGLQFEETIESILTEEYLLLQGETSDNDYRGVGEYAVQPIYTFIPEQPENYTLADPNPVSLTVNQAQLIVTISFENNQNQIEFSDPIPPLSTTFDGFTRGDSEEDVVASIQYFIDGAVSTSVETLSVGQYPVTASYTFVDDPANYFIVGPQELTLIIDQKPLEITFDPDNPEQTFGDTGEVGVDAEGVSVTVTYQEIPDGVITEEPPTDAGEYLVTVSSADPNFAGEKTTTLTIDPAEVFFEISGLDQSFDNNPKEIEFITSSEADLPEDLNIIVKYNGSPDLPKDAGTYEVTIEIEERNFITEGNEPVDAQLTIAPATLFLSAEDDIIKRGRHPHFNGTVTDFVNGDTFESVFGAIELGFELNADKHVAGFYPDAIIPVLPPTNNYTYVVDAGDLYVNPAGFGTENIKISLDCIQLTGDPDLPYLATFKYRNLNHSTVYIPFTGSEFSHNFIYAKGNYEVVGDPVSAFLPGEGEMQVRFDGELVKWKVISWREYIFGYYLLDLGYATDRSKVCPTKSDNTSQSLKVRVDDLTGYPNPVVDKFSIILNELEVERTEIMLLNTDGKTEDLRYTYNPSIKGIEIDMNGFKTGLYIIRIYNDEIDQVFNVFKK